MTLQEIFEAVRDHYLAGYREVLAGYREERTPGVPEVLFVLEGEEPEIYRHYRLDFTTSGGDEPDMIEINGESHLEFEPVELEYKGVDVSVSPLVWNGVEFCLRPELRDDARIQAWAQRWIDIEETAQADDDGLGAYVHTIGAPESAAGATSFSVDFGSAPIASVFELLDALRESGVRSIEMHSRTVIGEEEQEEEGEESDRSMKSVTVDALAKDPDGSFLLCFAEEGPWESDEVTRLRAIQNTLYDYFDVAVDGHLAERYPETSGKRIVIRVDTYGTPPGTVADFVAKFAEHIASSGEHQEAIRSSPHVASIAFECKEHAEDESAS
jgi:hypothetical protein